MFTILSWIQIYIYIKLKELFKKTKKTDEYRMEKKSSNESSGGIFTEISLKLSSVHCQHLLTILKYYKNRSLESIILSHFIIRNHTFHIQLTPINNNRTSQLTADHITNLIWQPYIFLLISTNVDNIYTN